MAKEKLINAVTNQNYYEDAPASSNDASLLKEVQKTITKLTVGDIRNTSSGYKNIVLTSFNRADFTGLDDESLVFEIVCRKKTGSTDQIFYLKTGLFVGLININGVQINIQPDYSQRFFFRMINYANNIYVNNSAGIANLSKQMAKPFPIFKFLFLSSLQKASVLGFPQGYKKQEYNDLKIHGQVDINNYIKKDIPFTGQIASYKNQRLYVQEIVDVLYYALKLAQDDEFASLFSHLGFVRSELKANFSGKKPSFLTIERAKHHRALANPMYRDFKKTIDYAELIIKQKDLDNDTSESKISGYLLDISALWEAYLAGLLKQHFKTWEIRTQEELSLYEGTFFHRPNYPDIVMEKEGKYVVFDAKFKKMNLCRDDVDRTDLFQIQSYAGYYNLISKNNLVLCGLLYPLSKKLTEEPLEKYQSTLYGMAQTETKFIIDGVFAELDNNTSDYDDITVYETEFLERVEKFL